MLPAECVICKDYGYPWPCFMDDVKHNHIMVRLPGQDVCEALAGVVGRLPEKRSMH